MKILNIISIFILAISVISSSWAGTLSNAGQILDDSAITTKIKLEMAGDKILDPFKIKVVTQNGIVKLAGVVDTDMQYQKAITLAQSTNGVLSVDADSLKVKNSKAPLKDTYITAKIEGILLKNSLSDDKQTQFFNVHVETKNGVVYVSGNVDTADRMKHILEVINSVEGVKSVKNDMNFTHS